jgi:uncharacterized protein (DUF885 family)
MTRSGILIFCSLTLVVGCRDATLEERLREDNLLNQLANEYFSERVRFYPVEATLNGYHEYDGELGDFRQGSIHDHLAWIRDFRQRLLGVDVTRVSPSSYIDLLLLTRAVKAELHTLGTLEEWRRSPLFYTERIRNGLWFLLRSESPSDIELHSLLSRLEQVPSVVDAARENIENPPRLLVEDAISELRSDSARIKNLSFNLGKSSSPRKLAELGRTSGDAARALDQFIVYLESDVLPRASSSFAIGSDELSSELLYEEMEDTPLETISEIAEHEIVDIDARMEEVVARLGDSREPGAILIDLASEHLAPTDLIQTTENILREIRRFTQERNLFESNPETQLRIVATPPVLRDDRKWFLSTPGCLEQGDGLSYFMLTLPWDGGLPQAVKPGVGNIDGRTLRLAVIREIHPGRFVSVSHQRNAASRTRQLLTSNASVDGWSHYVEQMLLDEGYKWDDPALRLVQLQNELIEECRLLTAIGLHAGQMSIAQATRIFQQDAFLDSERAAREARLVASDWRRANAALGKHQILKLREDYIGDEPSRTLYTFHRGLLGGAGLPLKLVRLLMIPQDQRPTLDY